MNFCTKCGKPVNDNSTFCVACGAKIADVASTKKTPDQQQFFSQWMHASRFSNASGQDLPYIVMQVTLKEKFLGTGSGTLTDLENVINNQVAKGYRLHTMSTSNGGSKGFGGGDRIQATLVFERLDMR